jgi:hypothetical protein
MDRLWIEGWLSWLSPSSAELVLTLASCMYTTALCRVLSFLLMLLMLTFINVLAQALCSLSTSHNCMIESVIVILYYLGLTIYLGSIWYNYKLGKQFRICLLQAQLKKLLSEIYLKQVGLAGFQQHTSQSVKFFIRALFQLRMISFVIFISNYKLTFFYLMPTVRSQ